MKMLLFRIYSFPFVLLSCLIALMMCVLKCLLFLIFTFVKIPAKFLLNYAQRLEMEEWFFAQAFYRMCEFVFDGDF